MDKHGINFRKGVIALKLYFKNETDFIIEFCSGMKEYEVGPGDSAEVDFADEDVMYIDTIKEGSESYA